MSLRIAFFGDSFVNGTGDPKFLGWTGRVCRAARERGHDVTAYNLGIRRDTSADILRRWAAEAQSRLPPEFPAALVFSFGVNDCVEEAGGVRVAPGDTLVHLRTLLEAAKKRATCLMIGPPPISDDGVNGRVSALCLKMDALCRRIDVPYLASFAPLSQSRIWAAEIEAGDGAHPGAGGYAELAALVDGWAGWRDLVP